MYMCVCLYVSKLLDWVQMLIIFLLPSGSYSQDQMPTPLSLTSLHPEQLRA